MPQNRPDSSQTRSHAHDVTVPWWVVGALAIMFVLLGMATTGVNTLAIDLDVSKWIQSFDGRFAQFLGWLGDGLGETRTALVGLAIGFIAAALLHSLRDALFIGIAAILRVLASVFLKDFYNSPRPTAEQVEQASVFENLGYPSGHATTASLVMGTLAYFIARRTHRPNIRIGLIALWLAGVSATAYARMWHGAHWFTDTVGGTIVGLVIVLVAANLSATIMDRRSSDPRTSPPRTPAP